jgi:hypothetical protein
LLHISRKTSITDEKLEACEKNIEYTTEDLEDHLDSVEKKLEVIVRHAVTASESDATELQLIQEEHRSTKKCLQICARLSEHLGQIRFEPRRWNRSASTSVSGDREAVPEQILMDGMKEWQGNFRTTQARLHDHMQDVLDRLMVKLKSSTAAQEDIESLESARAMYETARKCLDLCSEAEQKLEEQTTRVKNFAEGDDNLQVLVSTDGKRLAGENRLYGSRAQQLAGHMDGHTLRSISQPNARIRYRDSHHDDKIVSPPTEKPPVAGDEIEETSTTGFRERHGPGVQLASKTTATGLTEAEQPSKQSLGGVWTL